MIKLKKNPHSNKWSASLYDDRKYFAGLVAVDHFTPAAAVAEMHAEAEKLKGKLRKKAVGLQKKMDLLQKEIEEVDGWLLETVVEEEVRL